jgi:hypothetical protein
LKAHVSAREGRQQTEKDRPMNERMTTELFGLSLTAVFVCLLALNAISF